MKVKISMFCILALLFLFAPLISSQEILQNCDIRVADVRIGSVGVKSATIDAIDEIINVTKYETFTIDLRSNPTTGYTWEAKFDPTYIQMIDRTYKPDTFDPLLIGWGGTDTFVFRGIKSGETEIEFSYLRPWDRLTPPVEIKVFKIKIE